MQPDASRDAAKAGKRYVTVRLKFALALIVASGWAILSYQIAQRWITDLSDIIGEPLAILVILGIAILPGFMNAFLVIGLLLDRRPKRVPAPLHPDITIMVAAYNEESSILSTLKSIEMQHYSGQIEVIVINDGSTDSTMEKLASVSYPWLHVIDLPKNGGKANALNAGLERVSSALTITIDADSYLYANALAHIIGRFLGDPDNTAAVAGAVLVRNSRLNLATKIQEWDYFHGIAAVKRLQSLFQGTLVAQGAFSIYRTDVLREVGGWRNCVGEDIVLTWAILEHGYRVGYCEDACLFTNTPVTFPQFFRQRQRWSRGLIEAFKHHWPLLFRFRMITIFIWWNLLFPFLDFIYTFTFVPGIVLALFGYYWLAGPMTLLVLPLAMLVNYLIYTIQSRMFTEQGLKVRNNPVAFVFYALFYGVILQPVCFIGYLSEIFGTRKSWGTK
ncbi:MAG: glycosyl transferase family 2 [Betaproteobacteria bacterium RBG_16_56_24]|nr:MAG: glycosyl transferase family 2 [Betaproteobacteria bacterium RBG_16_56_24]